MKSKRLPHVPKKLKIVTLAIAEGASTADEIMGVTGFSEAEVKWALEHPMALLAAQDSMAAAFTFKLAPKAIRKLDGLLDSEDERVQVAAVKMILERSIPKPEEFSNDPAKAPGSDLASMPTDRLHEMVSRLEGELSERANTISNATDNVTILTPDQLDALNDMA